jgi:hypothetical protein
MSEHQRTGTDAGWLAPAFYRSPDGYAVVVHTTVTDGRRVIDRLVISGSDITAATLRGLRMGQIAAYAERGEPATERAYTQLTSALDKVIPPGYDYDAEPAFPRKPRTWTLSRPDGTDPEGFSRRVAEAYNDLVLWSSAPAKALAIEAGVPVTTVHRWIRDARRLGLLPPARKGRAG